MPWSKWMVKSARYIIKMVRLHHWLNSNHQFSNLTRNCSFKLRVSFSTSYCWIACGTSWWDTIHHDVQSPCNMQRFICFSRHLFHFFWSTLSITMLWLHFQQERVEQLLLESDSSQAIICDNLKKVYPGRDGNPEKFAVRGLSLALPRGECFGMLGPNGAGKTSFINMVSTIYSFFVCLIE